MTTTADSIPASDTDGGVLPLWAAIAMAVMSGSLLALGYSLQPLWWAGWLAPAPVFAAALAGPRGRAPYLGAIAGLLAGAATFTYYIEVTGAPVTIAIVLAHALLWSGAVRFGASAALRLRSPFAVFALPALIAGLEAVVAAVSPHGTAGSLAYSQMDALPLIQIASLGGVPAIVFVMLSGGSALGLFAGWLMGAPLPWRQVANAGALVTTTIAAALAFGAFNLEQVDAGPKVAIRLISTDQFHVISQDWPQVWAAYGPAVEAAADSGSVVVLPEKIALLSGAAARGATLQVAAVAQRHHATIALGLEVQDAAGHFANRAFVASADGRISTYDKQHLVPLLEARDRPGRSLLVDTIAGVRTGVAICKDMHFSTLGRDYGRARAQLMLVPAWDFGRDAWLSDRLTALRGVEGGYAIARATRQGYSSLSDRHGRILAQMRSSERVNVLRADATLSVGTTVYDSIGDVFGWLCLAGAIAFWLAIFLSRRAT